MNTAYSTWHNSWHTSNILTFSLKESVHPFDDTNSMFLNVGIWKGVSFSIEFPFGRHLWFMDSSEISKILWENKSLLNSSDCQKQLPSCCYCQAFQYIYFLINILRAWKLVQVSLPSLKGAEFDDATQQLSWTNR